MNKKLTLVANERKYRYWIIKDTLNKHIEITSSNDKPMANVFNFICSPETVLFPALRETLYDLKCDFALQDEIRPVKKLFISDMDATMVVGETIDEMAETLGIGEKISVITERAMRGEMGFEDALRQRLGLMKGIEKSTIIEMAKNSTLTKGAVELLAEINARDMDSCLISGGFSEFTQQVSEKLGFKRNKANQLAYDDNDNLAGDWVGELVNADVKVATLKQLAKKNAISLAQTIAVGDGANDSLMIEAAGLGVAYYGKPLLREVANAEIHSGSMENLVHFL